MNRSGKLIISILFFISAGLMFWDHILPWSAVASGTRTIYPLLYATLVIFGCIGVFNFFRPPIVRIGKEFAAHLGDSLVNAAYSKVTPVSKNDEVTILAKTKDGRSVAIMLDTPTEIRYTWGDLGRTRAYEEKQTNSLLSGGYLVIRVRYKGTPSFDMTHPNLLVCNNFPPSNLATPDNYQPIISFLT